MSTPMRLPRLVSPRIAILIAEYAPRPRLASTLKFFNGLRHDLGVQCPLTPKWWCAPALWAAAGAPPMQMQCGQETQLFQECVKNTGGDVAPCQSYMDMMMKCKARICPPPSTTTIASLPGVPSTGWCMAWSAPAASERAPWILSTDPVCCVCCRVPERLNAATSVNGSSEMPLEPAAARGAPAKWSWVDAPCLTTEICLAHAICALGQGEKIPSKGADKA
jgi:hypothetical protein